MADTCMVRSSADRSFTSGRVTRVNALWTAIRLLTCFPTPRVRPSAPGALVESLVWFPVVGAALGALLGLFEWGVRRATGNHVASAGVAVALAVLVTRGVHVRGLMIMTGALFSGRTQEEVARLSGLQAPTRFGLLAGMAFLLLRYALVLALPVALRLSAFVLAGALSRAAIVWVCWRFPYAETDTGIGGYFGTLAGARDLLWVLPLLALGFGTLGPIIAGGMLIAAWVLSHLFAMWVTRQVGGVTAHTYEAVAEAGELAAFAAVATLVLSGRI